MSHDQPADPPFPPAGEPGAVEYLGEAPRPHPGRRWGVVGVTAAAVVGVAAAAAWGVTQFLGAGAAPATAAPANTLAYVGLDLDPSGGQKLEALRTLRKFPALEDKLGIGSSDDLERTVLEKLVKESSCQGLDYADDIAPWLGDKLGFGAVPGGDGPVPFGIVQVTDATKARRGVAALGACGSDGSPGAKVGVGFTGDYMVLAETDKIAADIVAAVDKGSLADNATYRKWVDAAGGDGILTGYVAPDGLSAVLDSTALSSVDGGGTSEQKALAAFQGGALVARFDNEALQVELAAGGLPARVTSGGDSGITHLPSSTAVALGFGVGDTFVQDLVDGLRRSMGSDQVDAALSEVQTETGLTLPADLQALLGDGVAVAVDSSVDPGALSSGSLADLPVGVRITGASGSVMPALEKVLAATGAGQQGVVVEQRDRAVALGVSHDYVQQLVEGGQLGEQPRFRQALPDLPPGAGALYVDFDAGDWLDHALADAPGATDLRDNLQPLSSLGVTGGMQGSTLHAVLRLSTD